MSSDDRISRLSYSLQRHIDECHSYTNWIKMEPLEDHIDAAKAELQASSLLIASAHRCTHRDEEGKLIRKLQSAHDELKNEIEAKKRSSSKKVKKTCTLM